MAVGISVRWYARVWLYRCVNLDSPPSSDDGAVWDERILSSDVDTDERCDGGSLDDRMSLSSVIMPLMFR